MAEVERIGGIGYAGGVNGNFTALLASWIGTTVTIFTSSGGQSGSGFTGVLLSVNDVFVRLISRIGPPPGCALGSACNDFSTGGYGRGCSGGYGMNMPGAEAAGGWDGMPLYTVGSVVDIPVDSIVSFVHNAV